MGITMKRFLQLGLTSEETTPIPKVPSAAVVQESTTSNNPPEPLIKNEVEDPKSQKTRTMLPEIKYGSLIRIFDEYQWYTNPSEIDGLALDQTGYPTGGRDAQIKVLEHLLECGGTSNIGQILDLAMRIPDCRGTCHKQVVDKLAAQYQLELNDPNEHIDIPIVHYIDAALRKGKQCADQCGDDEAFKDICRLADDIETAFEDVVDRIVDASKTDPHQVLEERMANPNQRNLNELTPMDISMRFAAYPMYPHAAGVRSVWRFFDKLDDAESFSQINECMSLLLEMSESASRLYDVNPNGTLRPNDTLAATMESFSTSYTIDPLQYNPIMESKAGSTIREAGRNARNTMNRGAKKVAKGAAVVSSGARKVADPMVKFISDTKEKMQKADEEERRNMIINGGIMPKIYRWIKRGILLSAEAAVGTVVPVANILVAIQFIYWLANDKRLDRRTKNQILKEIDDEIELCNEKIDDARGDSSKEAKYKLIRIRNKLKRTGDRIRLNLKSAPIEEDIVTSSSARKKDTKEVEELSKKSKDDEF